MNIVLTVAVITIVYLLTVNEKYRRKIKRQDNKIFEIEQLINIYIIYGKKTNKVEAGKEASEDI